jgi:hypothetical protein
MTQKHPITPPPELVQQWWDGTHGAFYEFEAVVTQAARWGADQELEACRLWVSEESIYAARELVEARRPKPPSLKEQALELVDRIEKAESVWAMSELDTIRRALESLPS